MDDGLTEPIISYSLKDILERLEAKLDRKFLEMHTLIERKAEAADLNQVIQTQLDHSTRIGSLEHTRDSSRQQEEDKAKASGWRTEWRRWITTTVLAAALTASAIYQILHGG